MCRCSSVSVRFNVFSSTFTAVNCLFLNEKSTSTELGYMLHIGRPTVPNADDNRSQTCGRYGRPTQARVVLLMHYSILSLSSVDARAGRRPFTLHCQPAVSSSSVPLLSKPPCMDWRKHTDVLSTTRSGNIRFRRVHCKGTCTTKIHATHDMESRRPIYYVEVR